MNKTTTVSALFLAGAMLLSSTGASAIECTMPSRTTLAAAAVLSAFGMLYTRKSEKEFKSRFSAEKTRNVSGIFTTDYIKNAWYFIADEVIGQRKQSSAVKVKEDGKVYASEETPAHGVLGTVDAYVAPAVEGAKTYVFSYLLYRAVTEKGTLNDVVTALATKGASVAQDRRAA